MPADLIGYRFADFHVDLRTRELTSEGRRVRLAEKPFLVLRSLLERPGELVTRGELCRRLWPDGTAVDFDNNLNSAVATLREHLGDSARRPRLVETLPRLGYRFLAEVRQDLAECTSRAGRPGRLALALSGAAAVVVLVAGVALFTGEGAEQVSRPPAARQAALAGVPPDPTVASARAAYQQGLYLLSRRQVDAAAAKLTEAVELAPGFAPAHAALADALVHAAFESRHGLQRTMASARDAAERALALDAGLATPHRVLAAVALHLDWDVDEARRHVEIALGLDPSDGFTQLSAAALYSVLGLHDDAVAHARRAVELDPASHLVHADLAYFLLAAGLDGEAREACRVGLAVEPDFEPALRYLVVAEANLGRLPEAARAASRILQLAGESPVARADPSAQILHYRRWELGRASSAEDVSPLRLALAHASLGHRRQALAWLERACYDREPLLVYLVAYSQLRDLHGEPRFEAIRHRLGLAAG